jgi:primosomal protein N' (replication factor Y)
VSRLWLAALASPPFSSLTYAAPDGLPEGFLVPGQRVVVPLGSSMRLAVLLAPAETPPPGMELKSLVWPLEARPLLDAGYLELVRNLSSRHLMSPGRILASVLPGRLKSAKVRFRLAEAAGTRLLAARDLSSLPAAERARLAGLFAAGDMEMVPQGREEPWVSLAVDPPWAVRPGAKRQLAVLEALFERGPTPRAVLLAALGPSAASPLRELLRRGLVRLGAPLEAAASPCVEEPPGAGCTLTPEQEAALAELTGALSAWSGQARLVFGVTGSGKTLLYLRLAASCLAAGRSALLLAPEVALASALAREAASELPWAEPRLYHGSRPPSEREALFAELARSDAPRLVIGTRSALFLPLSRLGLVVLDEEHDESFKQEERLPYQAKEVAWFRARQAGALLVLGSATPDLKTFHATREGHMPMVSLRHRVGARRLPEVALVPLTRETDVSTGLSPVSLKALQGTVAAGDQAVILLNRRGYAPVMYCLACGEVVRCPACRVAYTYHKARERLLCHYCGGHLDFPQPCPSCKSTDFLPMGEGTEQLAEKLTAVLPPDTAILRLDRDSARRQERLEAILADFAAGKAQVLVGTQMLSKGHNFPGVTLAIVADADLGLNLPDYRAAERTFQLLVQVSGRAGRGDKPGRVLIQTHKPSHPFWRYVLAADYEGFYAEELESRRRFSYPPFARLALIRLSHDLDANDAPALLTAGAEALRSAGKDAGVRVLGPAPAPLAQLRGRKRFNCLLKSPDWLAIRQVYGRLLESLPRNGHLRASLDLDPVNML